MAGHTEESDQMELSDTRVEMSEDVAFRELNGEAVLLDLTSGTYFGLNEVGTRLWTLLARDGSLNRAIEALLGEFEVSAEALRADVDRLMAELNGKGLVRIIDGSN